MTANVWIDGWMIRGYTTPVSHNLRVERLFTIHLTGSVLLLYCVRVTHHQMRIKQTFLFMIDVYQLKLMLGNR
jgi:hypothetical protein